LSFTPPLANLAGRYETKVRFLQSQISIFRAEAAKFACKIFGSVGLGGQGVTDSRSFGECKGDWRRHRYTI
jgi:hypothetical protein